MNDTIKIDSKNAKMIAHRGLSGLEKENTAAAFVAAGNRAKYYGIETDVHPTADGKFVIIHDFDLKRLAGADVQVETSTLDELQNIVLTNVHGKAPRADLRVPELKDYLEICKKYGKKAVLELKSDFNDDQLVKMIEEIRSFDMLEDTIFISFYDRVLANLRKILPDQPMQFLCCEFNDQILKYLLENRFAIDIAYYSFTKEQIDVLKANNIEINIWTCDNKEDAEKYISWGVDYVTSNILE